MLNLIQNENMKIYRRLRTLILIGILVVLAVSIAILIRASSHPAADWKATVSSNNAQLSSQLGEKNNNIPSSVRDKMKSELAVGEYRLQHNIAPEDNTLWGGIMSMTFMIQFVTIFTVIIAADIVAGEFSAGTIKLLMIRPARRSKILLSKYIATIIFSLALLVVLFVTLFIINGLLYGFTDVGIPYLYASSDGAVHSGSMLLHVLGTFGLSCISLVMIVTMAFMISTVFRSSALAISMSLVLMFVGGGVALFLTRYSWGKYWLFTNTDLTQYIEGRPMMPGMTLSFSIMVLLGYFVVFNLLSWNIFNKRDITS